MSKTPTKIPISPIASEVSKIANFNRVAESFPWAVRWQWQQDGEDGTSFNAEEKMKPCGYLNATTPAEMHNNTQHRVHH